MKNELSRKTQIKIPVEISKAFNFDLNKNNIDFLSVSSSLSEMFFLSEVILYLT